MAREPNSQFSKKEAEKRFEAALRGARVTGHKTSKDIPKSQKGNKARPGTKGRPATGR